MRICRAVPCRIALCRTTYAYSELNSLSFAPHDHAKTHLNVVLHCLFLTYIATPSSLDSKSTTLDVESSENLSDQTFEFGLLAADL